MNAIHTYSIVDATFFDDVQDILARGKYYHERVLERDSYSEIQYADAYYSKRVRLLNGLAYSQRDAVEAVLDNARDDIVAKFFYPKDFDSTSTSLNLDAKRRSLEEYQIEKARIFQTSKTRYETKDRVDAAYAKYLKTPHVYRVVYGCWLPRS